jgi:RNA polymerase sigma-70 factor (ECF subfamily)
VRAHYASIYRFLLHMVHDTSVAEDLTQETFVTVWQKIDSFRGHGSLKGWLYRIAYRKFIDAQRRMQRSVAVVENLRLEYSETTYSDELEKLMAEEYSRRLYGAVQRLGKANRVIIVLHYFQGMSYRQMAEVLDKPTGTLKWRTKKALGELKEVLTKGSEHDHR